MASIVSFDTGTGFVVFDDGPSTLLNANRRPLITKITTSQPKPEVNQLATGPVRRSTGDGLRRRSISFHVEAARTCTASARCGCGSVQRALLWAGSKGRAGFAKSSN